MSQKHSDEESDTHSDKESANESGEEPEIVVSQQTESNTDKRPRKRRKVEEDLTEEPRTHTSPSLFGEPSSQKETRRSSTPPAALPAFPLPRRPDAPSKSTLALQGLDKALVEAELVNPSTSHTLPESGDDSSSGLTERTVRRLKELGITELFAGEFPRANLTSGFRSLFLVQTSVIPFLLADSRQRSLYLPYNSPRDLCASAPTGSGKTLAYVLPIVEVSTSRFDKYLRHFLTFMT